MHVHRLQVRASFAPITTQGPALSLEDVHTIHQVDVPEFLEMIRGELKHVHGLEFIVDSRSSRFRVSVFCRRNI